MKKTFLTSAIALIAGLALSLTAMAATSTTTQTYNGVANYQITINITCTPEVFNYSNISYVANDGYINFANDSSTVINNMDLSGTKGSMQGAKPQYKAPILNYLLSSTNPGTLTTPYSSGFALTTSTGNTINVPLIDYNGNGTLTVLSGGNTFGSNSVTYASTSSNNTITLNVSIQ